MKITNWSELSPNEREQILNRPVNSAKNINNIVSDIIKQVQTQGDSALFELTQKLDKVSLQSLKIEKAEIEAAKNRVSPKLKSAIQQAYNNISAFHRAQIFQDISIETQAGVKCELTTRPIESVGLYIPGGSAPLFSSILMLAIPAKIAGCKKVILCSPPKIDDAMLYCADLCGVDAIYTLGGAQAIAAMAFGTASIPKVDKIFGPGNAFVTEAKQQVSQMPKGAAIDMPAGPSEVLVIADENANPEFVAADLLSQAEHGADSQVILLSPSSTLLANTLMAIEQQLKSLSRKEIAQKALENSQIILCPDLEACVDISNLYAPEHLIIQTAQPRTLLSRIQHAGSVFLGAYSPESMGDYASGTNHVLPTYGYAKTYSSLGLADFSKRMTIQELSPQGFLNLASEVEIMAATEQLDAHKNAVTLRKNFLNQTK